MYDTCVIATLSIYTRYYCDVYVIGKGMSIGTWKHLEKSSANARKDVIDGINSTRSRREQIAKCVKALR